MSGTEDRIRKLLAMAEHPNSNPNEAAMAASRAAQMAAEHNIDLEALRTRGDAPKKLMARYSGPSTLKRSDVDAFGFIMTGCGRLYGAAPCFTNTPSSSTLGYYFLGQEHNAKMAIKWAEYLWECCKRANTEHARQANYGSAKRREEARHSFRYAFGVTVLARLMEKHREMTKPPEGTSDSRALAIAHFLVAEFKEAEDLLRQDTNLRDMTSKQKALQQDAFTAGARAGKSVSIADQIGRG